MEAEARKVEVAGFEGSVQRVKPPQDPGDLIRSDLPALAGFEKLLQTLVREAADHNEESVKSFASLCQLLVDTPAARYRGRRAWVVGTNELSRHRHGTAALHSNVDPPSKPSEKKEP